MRVTIDSSRCQGHGRCYSLSPEVFDSDDDGYGTVRPAAAADDALRDQAELGAVNCPEAAINVED